MAIIAVGYLGEQDEISGPQRKALKLEASQTRRDGQAVPESLAQSKRHVFGTKGWDPLPEG